MRMAKLFGAGELTGRVMIRTRNIHPNCAIILPERSPRSLVIHNIDLENLGNLPEVFLNPPGIEVGDVATVTYDPRNLYKNGTNFGGPGRTRRGFFNWVIDIRNVKSLKVSKSGIS